MIKHLITHSISQFFIAVIHSQPLKLYQDVCLNPKSKVRVGLLTAIQICESNRLPE